MAGQLTIDTLRAGSGVLATQNGMTGIAKAWVNFVGSSATISSSFNVSSITRTSAGFYTVNLTTAMPNANYSVVGTAGMSSTNWCILIANATPNSPYFTTPTTTSFTVVTTTGTSSANITDAPASVAVFSS
jgi:PKD repeat protein